MTETRALPPLPDEAEVSIFGPGVGECIVVHLGQGEWMVVDSCLEEGEPIALRYLRRLGVSPTAITDVVVTHWHNDHIGGAAKVLEAAPNARLTCSGALNCKEFQTMLRAWDVSDGTSGLSEMGALLRLELERKKRCGGKPNLVWAIEGLALISSSTASVHVLSPSHQTKTLAFQELGQYLPRVGQKLRPVSQTPNQLAVTLWVRIGDLVALLGADLERTKTVGTGWGAVVTSTMRPTGKADVFKVPHHGSVGADEPDVWRTMLRDGCVAVVTPYNALGNPIPRDTDQQRLLSRTNEVYLSSLPGGKRTRRAPDIAKSIRQMTRELREVSRKTGQVRVRCNPNQQPRVEVFDGAYRVEPSLF